MNPSAQTNLQRSIPLALPVRDEEPSGIMVTALLVRDDELPVAQPTPRKRHFLFRCVAAVGSALQWLFGFASLFIGLAVLAALPALQFLSLGYLLEAGGRVARTGRLRDGFIGFRIAARLGGVVLGAWLFLWPVRFVSDMARSAEIIDPNGRVAAGWRFGLFVLIGLTFVHIALACARGGKLRYFFWPFNWVWLIRRLFRGGYYTEARDAVWDVFASLRLPYYFWLGFRGFIGAFAWLALPITLLAVGRAHFPAAPLVGFVGALMLAIVLLYLPFLQMRLAATNRLRGAFELASSARRFRSGAVGVYHRIHNNAVVRLAALPIEDTNCPT